jgi:hypothetical protein
MPNRTMMLPCELSDDDRLRVSGVLTAEIKAREQVEAAKKAAVKDFNVALKAHKAKEHDFNESLFTGKELRDVEVEDAQGLRWRHRVHPPARHQRAASSSGRSIPTSDKCS